MPLKRKVAGTWTTPASTHLQTLTPSGWAGQITGPPAPFIYDPWSNSESLYVYFKQYDTGGQTITNYEWTVDDGQTWTAFNPIDKTSPVLIPGLTNGRTYTAKLRAVSAQGAGYPSNALTSALIGNKAAAPENLVQTEILFNGGTFTWDPPLSSGDNPILGYVYTVPSLGVNAIPVRLPAVSPMTVTGALHTPWSFAVAAVTANGRGFGKSLATAQAIMRPAAPTISNVASLDGGLSVAFTQPVYDGEVIVYMTMRVTDENTFDEFFAQIEVVDNQIPASIGITGLTNGSPYFLEVSAMNQFNQISDSDTGYGTPHA